MKSFLVCAVTAVLPLSTSLLAVNDDHDHKEHKLNRAVAVVQPTQKFKTEGVIHLKQKDGQVSITGKVKGLTPGKHGFHIHQYGDLSADDGSSAGGHYAPEGHEHGGPHKAQHHAGDLGNIVADENGVAMIDKQSDDFELSDVIGRAFVVHAGTDDLTSQPSGDAGARAGLAVIGISK